jgi:hypothetical protein
MHTSVLRGLALASLATLSALGATVGVAGSAGAADTTTTFTITTQNDLSVSVPTQTVNLGSVGLDAPSISSSLGPVRVDDKRGILAATWTATVTATDFVTTPQAGKTVTIPKASIDYDPGEFPTGASLGTVPVMGTGGDLAGARTAASVVSVVGTNWVSWNPTVKVNLPAAGRVAGTYTGTITHSVS